MTALIQDCLKLHIEANHLVTSKGLSDLIEGISVKSNYSKRTAT
jgi:hypothetical protein